MIQALSTRLIIRQIKNTAENTTTSGIVLSSGSDDTALAEIVSVGPDCKQRLKVGDRVVPIWNRCQHARVKGQDLFGIDEQDIVGRV